MQKDFTNYSELYTNIPVSAQNSIEFEKAAYINFVRGINYGNDVNRS